MKKFILPIVALLAFAGIASANPRAVAFRGGNAGFRNAAFRAPVVNALRFAGNLALRGHGAAFRVGINQFNAFRGQNFYGTAFRNSFIYRQNFVQPLYAQSFVQPIIAPAYTQGFAQPLCGGGAAYTQPYVQQEVASGCGCGAQGYTQGFSGYQQGYSQPFQGYSGLALNTGLYGLPLNLGYGHHHGGHHGGPRHVPVPVPGAFRR